MFSVAWDRTIESRLMWPQSFSKNEEKRTHERGFKFSKKDFSRSSCWSVRTVSIQVRRIAADHRDLVLMKFIFDTTKFSKSQKKNPRKEVQAANFWRQRNWLSPSSWRRSAESDFLSV
jgi:hypothetical protein